MRFLYIDNQLPPAFARFIEEELGRDAKHVADVGLRDASDAEVWQYASANELVLVSKDEDFTHMAFKTFERLPDLAARRELSTHRPPRPLSATVAEFA